MKKLKLIAAGASLLALPLLTLVSCSGASEGKEDVSVVTEDHFSAGKYNFIVYGPTEIIISPTGVYSGAGDSAGAPVTEGVLIVGETIAPVYYTYETFGSADSPSLALLRVSLRDESYSTNQDLIRGLGVGTTTRITGIQFSFDYAAENVDIVTSGIQTRNPGIATDVIVHVAHDNEPYRIVEPASF